jgi:hypothetical protein
MVKPTALPAEPGVRPEAGDRLLVIANPKTRRNADHLIESLRGAAPEGVEPMPTLPEHACWWQSVVTERWRIARTR